MARKMNVANIPTNARCLTHHETRKVLHCVRAYAARNYYAYIDVNDNVNVLCDIGNEYACAQFTLLHDTWVETNVPNC